MPETVLKVRVVNHARLVELAPHWDSRSDREHRVALAASLRTSNNDFAALEVEVLYAEFETLVQTQARPVEEKGDQAVRPGQTLENGGDLASREDRGQVL